MKKKRVFWLLPVVLISIGIYFSTVPIADFLAAACFVLAGIAVAALLLPKLYRCHPRTAKILASCLVLVILLTLVLMTFTGVRIVKAAAEQPDADCRYIVVLGAKVNGTVPSDNLRCRIDAAYDYLIAHPETVAVLSGGQGSDEVISEAQCMYNALAERGIDPQRLWLEENATSTWENITFSLDLIQEKTGKRPETVGLVTSEFHLYRAGLFAADCGVTAVGIPAKTEDRAELVYYFLREIAGVWHYYLLGGQYHD